MIGAVTLSWPDKILLPNQRSHWAPKARAAKKARMDAAWATRVAGFLPVKADALRITCVFFPPDKRHRDVDGMLSSLKPALDGISDAIGIDDSKWQIALRREAPQPPHGSVRIEIEAADTAQSNGA